MVGQWTCLDPAVLLWQATLMSKVGISGVWFDYQGTGFNACIELMIPILARLGMTFSLMLDTYSLTTVMDSMTWIKTRMNEPNYETNFL